MNIPIYFCHNIQAVQKHSLFSFFIPRSLHKTFHILLYGNSKNMKYTTTWCHSYVVPTIQLKIFAGLCPAYPLADKLGSFN